MSTQSDSSGRAVDVKVLSQLPDPDARLCFASLPVTTTVRDLKDKIHNALSTKPPLDRMRLIYRGRLLNRESDVLRDVFEIERAASDVSYYNLHLVIRDGTQQTTIQGGQHPAPVPTRDALPSLDNPISQSSHESRQYHQDARTLRHAHAHASARALPQQANTPVPATISINESFPTAQVHPQTPFGSSGHGIHPNHNPTHAAGFTSVGQPGMNPHWQQMLQQHAQQHHMQHIQQAMQMQMQQMMAAAQQQHHQPQFQSPSLSSQAGLAIHGNHRTPLLPTTQQQQQQRPFQSQIPSTQDGSSPSFAASTALHASRNLTRSASPRPRSGPHDEGALMSGQIIQDSTPSANINSNTQAGLNISAIPRLSSTGSITPHHPASIYNAAHNMSGEAFQRMQDHPQSVSRQLPYVPTASPSRTSTLLAMADWPRMPPLGAGNEYYGAAHAMDSMRHYASQLEILRSRLNSHLLDLQHPQPEVATGFQNQSHTIVRFRNRGQYMINDLLSPHRVEHHGILAPADIASLQQLNDQFTVLLRIFNEDLAKLRVGPVSSQGIANPSSSSGSEITTEQALRGSPGVSNDSSRTDQNETSRTQSIVAYLLNGPTGPRAVLYSSRGAFQSSLAMTEPMQSALNHGINASNTDSFGNNFTERVNLTDLRQNHHLIGSGSEVAQGNPDTQQIVNQDGNRPGNEMADAGNRNPPLNPPEGDDLTQAFTIIFRYLSLILRVGAFVWLLSRGMSTQRTIFLACGLLIYLAAQGGVFGEPWDRFRRHLEGLLGIPHEDMMLRQQNDGQPDRSGNADNRNNALNEMNQNERPQRNTPARPDVLNPRDTAARLLNERRQRDRAWLRNQIIAAERGVALFLASLYPGVGERHVQARERAMRQAAEDRRREQEQLTAALATPTQQSVPQEPGAPVSPSAAAAEMSGSTDQDPVKQTSSENPGMQATSTGVDLGEGSASSGTVRRVNNE